MHLALYKALFSIPLSSSYLQKLVKWENYQYLTLYVLILGPRCNLCAQTFDSEDACVTHRKRCPAKPTPSHPKWVCNECGKSFVSGKRYLQDHIMMVHKGLPPYRCDVCHKGFTTLANFKSHVLLHGTDRPFNCHQCNRGFAQKGNFLRHMKGVHGMQITFKSRKAKLQATVFVTGLVQQTHGSCFKLALKTRNCAVLAKRGIARYWLSTLCCLVINSYVY